MTTAEQAAIPFADAAISGTKLRDRILFGGLPGQLDPAALDALDKLEDRWIEQAEWVAEDSRRAILCDPPVRVLHTEINETTGDVRLIMISPDPFGILLEPTESGERPLSSAARTIVNAFVPPEYREGVNASVRNLSTTPVHEGDKGRVGVYEEPGVQIPTFHLPGHNALSIRTDTSGLYAYETTATVLNSYWERQGERIIEAWTSGGGIDWDSSADIAAVKAAGNRLLDFLSVEPQRDAAYVTSITGVPGTTTPICIEIGSLRDPLVTEPEDGTALLSPQVTRLVGVAMGSVFGEHINTVWAQLQVGDRVLTESTRVGDFSIAVELLPPSKGEIDHMRIIFNPLPPQPQPVVVGSVNDSIPPQAFSQSEAKKSEENILLETHGYTHGPSEGWSEYKKKHPDY